jgi:hypothetical protein
MEIRNQVFGVSKAFFVLQETPEAMVGLLRQGKNLVSLQMSGSETSNLPFLPPIRNDSSPRAPRLPPAVANFPSNF